MPPHRYEATLAFYRDVLRLPEVAGPTGDATGFVFGPCNLWVDNCPGLSQAEIWLEVVTADVEDAANVMASAGLARRDEIEDLGPGFDGFWISSPSDTIHLVAARTQTWA